MGYPMAHNLARARASHATGSPPVLVWNRSLSKSEMLLSELGPDNVRVAESPAQVATMCDVIVTNLANDEIVKAIYEEYSNALTVRGLFTLLLFYCSILVTRICIRQNARYLWKPVLCVHLICCAAASLKYSL